MTISVLILLKAFWCGCAALAFGVLFNAPMRALLPVWIGGCLAGLMKFGLMHPAFGASVILASFIASVSVGVTSIPIAHLRHVTPMIFAIPSVIPLVPGAYAYKTILGLMKLTRPITSEYSMVMSETVHNAVITLFIILAISLGVAVPMHIMRKESVKNIRLSKRKS